MVSGFQSGERTPWLPNSEISFIQMAFASRMRLLYQRAKASPRIPMTNLAVSIITAKSTRWFTVQLFRRTFSKHELYMGELPGRLSNGEWDKRCIGVCFREAARKNNQDIFPVLLGYYMQISNT